MAQCGASCLGLPNGPSDDIVDVGPQVHSSPTALGEVLTTAFSDRANPGSDGRHKRAIGRAYFMRVPIPEFANGGAVGLR